MPGIIVVGAQWGDEGKGKVVDMYANDSDYVVRYQGGCNAGHTLVVNGKKTVLHQIPSGILNPNTVNVIAQGCVVNLEILLDEIDKIMKNEHISAKEMQKRLKISGDAAIIAPYNVKIDRLREKNSNKKIGTTGKGIGPTYEDIAARKSVKINDLFDVNSLKLKLRSILDEKNAILKHLCPHDERIHYFSTVVAHELHNLGKKIEKYVCDTGDLIRKELKNNKKVLFEGAQGALLDVNHGTYPFVTSSQTGIAGVFGGAGVPMSSISKSFGVVKAYQTRVGSGPMPTELKNGTGELLRSRGQEYGATTGRARRCGWLDLPALKYSAEINEFDKIVLMKLDILSNLEEIKVCTEYKYNENSTKKREFQPENAIPVYSTLPGWGVDITNIKKFENLPTEAQNYVKFIEQHIEVPVEIIGVGPGRDEIVAR